MANEPILLDSDALVGWLVASDAHHQRAVTLFRALTNRRMLPVVTNLVVGETATLLSNRHSQTTACQFLDMAHALKTVTISEALHLATVELFAQQARNHTTYVDMANVVVLRTFNIPYIFAFDQVYTRDFQLPFWTV